MDKQESKKEKVRLNLSIPSDVDQQLRELADHHGLTISGTVSMIMQQYFDQQKLIQRTEQIPKWFEELAKIREHEKMTTE